MAEKIKDAEDRLLESLFQSAPIKDDGFSDRIVKKVRRQLWLRRLTLPIAAAVGGAIAIRPLAEVVSVMKNLSQYVPQNFVESTTGAIPQLPLVLLGAAVLAVCMIGLRALEE